MHIKKGFHFRSTKNFEKKKEIKLNKNVNSVNRSNIYKPRILINNPIKKNAYFLKGKKRMGNGRGRELTDLEKKKRPLSSDPMKIKFAIKESKRACIERKASFI